MSFSAHVDYVQNWTFIKSVVPDNIILVHGEKSEMANLKSEIELEIKRGHWADETHSPPVLMPRNGQRVELAFRKSVTAVAVGSAAQDIARALDEARVREPLLSAGGEPMPIQAVPMPKSALLVSNNFTFKIISVAELATYTSLRRGRLTNRQHVPIPKAVVQLFTQKHTVTAPLTIAYPYLLEVFGEMDSSVFRRRRGQGAAPGGPRESTEEDGGSPAVVVYHYVQPEDKVVYHSVHPTAADYISIGDVVKVLYFTPDATPAEPFSSLVVEWACDPSIDWLAEAAVCAVTYAVSVENALRTTTTSSLFSKGSHHEELSETVLRMRSGLVNPAAASDDIDGRKLEDERARKRMLLKLRNDLRDACVSSSPVSEVPVLDDSRDDSLYISHKHTWFSSVDCDVSGKRLIFRSSFLPAQSSTDKLFVPAEGYLFVEWETQSGDGASGHRHVSINGVAGKKHHAVVQSESDVLRAQIFYVLEHLHSW